MEKEIPPHDDSSTSEEEEEEEEEQEEVDPALLTNIEVAEFLRDLLFYELPFQGVFSVNEIPTRKLKMLKYWAIIVNLDKTNEPGSHFVALTRNEDGRFFFFDSLNLNPSVLPKSLMDFIDTISSDTEDFVWTLNSDIQAIDSTACGYFCIFFILLWHFCNPSYAEINDLLKPMTNMIDKNKNDVFVYRTIRQLMSNYVDLKTQRLRKLHLDLLPIFPKLTCNHRLD